MYDVKLQGVMRFRNVTDGLSNTVAVSEQILGMGFSGGGGCSFNSDSHPRLNASGQIRRAGAQSGDVAERHHHRDRYQPRQLRGGSLRLVGRHSGQWMNGHYGDTIYNHGLTPNAKTFDCGNLSHNAGLTAARSRHTGGVMTLLCDGSVRFVSDSIDLGICALTGSLAGGEALVNSNAV